MRMIRSVGLLSCLRALFVGATLLAASPSGAATITVGTGCSITQAVSAANSDTVVGSCSKGSGHDDIVLSAGTYTLSTPIDIRSDLTIRGAGMGKTTIVSSSVANPAAGMTKCGSSPAAVYVSAKGSTASLPVRLQDFTLKPATSTVNRGICEKSGDMTLVGVRVTGFQALGIWAESSSDFISSLHLQSCWVDSNFSTSNGGGVYLYQHEYGGFEASNFSMDKSTISDNFSAGCGGGLYLAQDPSLWLTTFHTIDASTISGNEALLDGGGICEDIAHDATYLMVRQTTIADNYAAGIGGGIWKLIGDGGVLEDPHLDMGRIILDGNISGTDPEQDNLNYHPTRPAQEARTNSTESLIYLEGPSWTELSVPDDGSGQTYFTFHANYGPLIGKGGVNNLPVHPLLTGSPVIDSTAESSINISDQRGVLFPIDGDSNGVALCDRGAYEFVPFQLETENLTVAGKSSGVTHNVLTGSSYRWYSGGGGTNLVSSATNQYVVYQTPVLFSGTYSVSVRYRKGPDAGKYQLSKGNSLTDVVNQTGSYAAIGAAVDTYASSEAWTEQALGNVTFDFTSSGIRYLKLKVTGKNSSSSSYRLYPDYIMLIKQ